MNAEDKITLIPRRNLLINGAHAAAGVAIEVTARTATELLQGGDADVVKQPAAQKRETASVPPAGAETAAVATDSPTAKPKAPKRKMP